jgi:4'-phosphopantetheinyl transferase
MNRLHRMPTEDESSAELDVWVAALDRPHPSADGLPPQDRARAEEFLRPEAAGRWVASRWALRRVLSAYLDEPPAGLTIGFGEDGKPRLVDGGGLEFNLSHAGELVLVAVSLGRPVGVDVERVEPTRDLLALADRALGEEDVAKVRSAAPAERAAAFYERWVRHEARLKCLGAGLAGTPPKAPVAVQNIDVASGYAAAVAVSGGEVGVLKIRSLDAG